MPSVDPSPLLDAAFARHQAGDVAEAMRLYREVLAADPFHADALHMLGVTARQLGNNDLALKLIDAALTQRPTMALAWHNRSLILRVMGRSDEALQSAEQATGFDPNLAEAWNMVGFLLRDKKDFERSRAAHARAVALQPNDLTFLGNYALLLLATGELRQAYDLMRGIERQNADLMPQTMGNILKACGYPERALSCYVKSRALLPENDEVRVTEAMTRLQIGEFAEGWALWETRPSLDPRFRHLPFWQGQPVEHLLLHEDQGIGDALMCARYIPDIHRYAKRVTLQVTRVLKKLFEASCLDVDILTLDDPVPAADARIRLLSLPAILGATAASIPTPIPYLQAREEGRRIWRERLAAVPKPRTGIVWAGNPDHLFAQLAPLLEAGNAHVVSLQMGKQKKGVDLAAAGLFDATPFLGDFADTAALMAELDLMICVDTAAAHLAGAMGKPVWLLLPFDPDWRWLLGREDSPWYPTMRLFRQQEPRNWPQVIERVAADLRLFLVGDAGVLSPSRWNGACLRQNPGAISLPE
jgi:tetratricopeptide (TPR) repeat protein